MRLLLFALALLGLLCLGVVLSIRSGTFRLSDGNALLTGPIIRPAAHPATLPANLPTSAPTTHAASADAADPMSRPTLADRAIVLLPAQARLSGPQLYVEVQPPPLRPSEDGNRLRRERRRRQPPTPSIRGWRDGSDGAEWTFDVREAGNYAVNLVCTNGVNSHETAKAGGFIVAVGDQTLQTPPAGTGAGYKMLDAGLVRLPAGRMRLVLRMQAANVKTAGAGVRSVRLFPAE